jgi:hypothetical protein
MLLEFGRILAGVLLGLDFFMAGWPIRQYLKKYHSLPLFSPAERRIGNINATRHLLVGAAFFYIIAILGQGIVFGIDFTVPFGNTTYPTSFPEVIANKFLIASALVGMFFGLALGAIGMWFDFSVEMSKKPKYIIWSVLALMVINFRSLVTLFVLGVLLSRIGGSIIMTRLSSDKQKTLALYLLLPSNVLLLFFVYISRIL